MHAFARKLCTGCAMLLFTRLRRWSDVMVERGIFGKRDSHLAVKEFRDRL